MTILDPIRAYSTPLTLVLVIFGPQLLNRTLAYLAQRNRPPNSSPLAHPHSVAFSRRLKVFLALHTLYHLSHLLIPPYDLFSTPHLPILAPNDLLRSRLSPSSTPITGDASPNPLIDLLLSRLQNLDNRLLYLRFGHRSLQDCLWCATPLDYLVASLPDILARYAWAAAVIMFMGSRAAGDGAELRGKRWGGAGLWAVGIMCLAEIGVKYLWDLRITSGDTFHVSLPAAASDCRLIISWLIRSTLPERRSFSYFPSCILSSLRHLPLRIPQSCSIASRTHKTPPASRRFFAKQSRTMAD
jgi:hypothetical protein